MEETQSYRVVCELFASFSVNEIFQEHFNVDHTVAKIGVGITFQLLVRFQNKNADKFP